MRKKGFERRFVFQVLAAEGAQSGRRGGSRCPVEVLWRQHEKRLLLLMRQSSASWPVGPTVARTDFAALRLCRPTASIRVLRGIAAIAARQSIRSGKPFPSARCASASETTEAMGDPLRPLVRLSAPPGHGRLAPPLRAEGREVARVRSEGLLASERFCPQPVVSPRHGRLKVADCLRREAQT